MTTQRDLTNAEAWAANQRGFITDAQRAEASRLCFSSTEISLLFLGGLSFVVAVASYIVDQPAPPPWALWVIGLCGGSAVVLTVGVVSRVIRRQQLIRADLAAGEVHSTPGWVYEHNGPMATFVQQPRGALREVHGLKVGAYRFHYLPRSGVVLSAEFQPRPLVDETIHLEDESEDPSPPAPVDLSTALGFTEIDLQHNRNRRLSPAQRATLQRQFVRELFTRLAWALVLGYYAWNLFTQSVACQGPIFLLSLVVLFFMFGGVLSDWLVIHDNHVSQFDGEFTRELEPAAHVTPAGGIYECDFSGRKFDVPAEAYALLADGERYRIYSVISRSRPLSLERLPAAVVAPDAEPPTNSQVT